MLLFFLFILGLFIGSFLNVLVDRLPREESIAKGRSHCEFCKHTLAWYDLVPVFSFIQLKGKCRYCRSPLSYYYPIVELTTGILFVLTASFVLNSVIPSPVEGSYLQVLMSEILYFVQNDIMVVIFHLYIVSSLIVIFFADLKYGIIPDKITYPAIIITLLFLVFNSFTSKESWLSLSLQPATFEAGNRVTSALGAFLLFLFLFLITKGRGMGFGDVKLAFLMGIFLGFPGIVIALYVAFLTGAIFSLILIVWGKKKLKGSTIPFGPFLVFGSLVSLFWGNELLRMALRLLNFSQ